MSLSHSKVEKKINFPIEISLQKRQVSTIQSLTRISHLMTYNFDAELFDGNYFCEEL